MSYIALGLVKGLDWNQSKRTSNNSSDNRYGSTGSTIINCARFVSEFNA